MDSITFCIPFYGKEPAHTEILCSSLDQIITFYPHNPIFVCKTSDSFMPNMGSYPNVKVYNTSMDGTHIIGAMELLIKNCNTTRFLIVHDSMFLLKALPSSILDRDFFSLWHFNEQSPYFCSHEIIPFIEQFNIPDKERRVLYSIFRSNPTKEWDGIFGPAFGGTMKTLHTMWSILNINDTNVKPYIGRKGLMASERILAIACIYMGFDLKQSLNGNIYQHPGVFVGSQVPDFTAITYPGSYFYKIWKKRE